MSNALLIHPKVTGGLAGSALGVLAMWILALVHVQATPDEGAALVAVLAAAGGWLAPIANAERNRILNTITIDGKQIAQTVAAATTTAPQAPTEPPPWPTDSQQAAPAPTTEAPPPAA